jgi:hypothetical protein
MLLLLAHGVLTQLAWRFPFNSSAFSGWAGDVNYSPRLVSVSDDGVFSVQGVKRFYLVRDHRQTRWENHRYHRFDLRGKTLRFTVDVSGTQCLCVASVYLAHMPDPNSKGSRYCGIRVPRDDNGGVCTELDLMEANVKAYASTLHTQRGTGRSNGACDDDGCVVNWGNRSVTRLKVPAASLYGPHDASLIDTRRPFTVSASASADGALTTAISQDGIELGVFNSSSAGVSREDIERTAAAFDDGGLVLALSQWGGFDSLQSWFNGVCSPDFGKCDEHSRHQNVMKLWDLQLFDSPPMLTQSAPSTEGISTLFGGFLALAASIVSVSFVLHAALCPRRLLDSFRKSDWGAQARESAMDEGLSLAHETPVDVELPVDRAGHSSRGPEERGES